MGREHQLNADPTQGKPSLRILLSPAHLLLHTSVLINESSQDPIPRQSISLPAQAYRFAGPLGTGEQHPACAILESGLALESRILAFSATGWGSDSTDKENHSSP